MNYLIGIDVGTSATKTVLFDENGNRRAQYRDKKYDTQVMNWYNRAKALEGPAYNKQHTDATRRQMRNLENGNDDIAEKIKKVKESGADTSTLTKADKIGHGLTDEDKDRIDYNADVKKENYTYRHHISHSSDYDGGPGVKEDDGIHRAGDSSRPDNSQTVNNMYDSDAGGEGQTAENQTPTGSGKEKRKSPPKIGGVKD